MVLDEGGMRNRTAQDLNGASSGEAAADDDPEDPIVGGPAWPYGLNSHTAAALVGIWALSIALANGIVVLARREVDGHTPPFLIPSNRLVLAATALLISLLLVPWSILFWRQLRPQKLAWKNPDIAAMSALLVSASGGAFCLLACRDLPTSSLMVAGTTAFSLAAVSVVVLATVRMVIFVLRGVANDAWDWEPRAARGGMALVAALALWTGFEAPAVQQLELYVPGLPAAASGYTLCMLSDLHAGPAVGTAALRAIVGQMRPLGCRAIVLNGDISEGTVAERAEEMRSLLPLVAMAPDGSYFVPGNHEFYNFAAPGGGKAVASEWTHWWAAHGVRALNNTQVQLPLQETQKYFALAGVDDPLGSPALEAALRPRPPGDPRRRLPTVLLAHRPVPHVFKAAELGVAVQLSGHTHGGQLWPVHVLAQHHAKGYLSGLYKVRDTQLYVSDGTVGSYMTRLRLFSRAEITQVFLRSHPVPGPAWRQANLGIALAWGFVFIVGLSALRALVLIYLRCSYYRKRFRSPLPAPTLRVEGP